MVATTRNKAASLSLTKETQQDWSSRRLWQWGSLIIVLMKSMISLTLSVSFGTVKTMTHSQGTATTLPSR